eukprot:scaffold4.g4602.t1
MSQEQSLADLPGGEAALPPPRATSSLDDIVSSIPDMPLPAGEAASDDASVVGEQPAEEDVTPEAELEAGGDDAPLADEPPADEPPADEPRGDEEEPLPAPDAEKPTDDAAPQPGDEAEAPAAEVIQPTQDQGTEEEQGEHDIAAGGQEATISESGAEPEAAVEALEPMLVRIEKHFKNEKEGRTRAEALLQQALAERDALAAQLQAQSMAAAQAGAAAADAERARQEMAAQLEAWRAQAQAGARAVEEARSELLARRQELDSTKSKMDLLADRLLLADGGSGAAGAGAGSPKIRAGGARRAPGAGGAERLPHLKTRAVPGAALAVPPAAAAPAGGGLPSLPPGGGSPPWAGVVGGTTAKRPPPFGYGKGPAAPPDRDAESRRDAAMIAYQSRWNKG